MGGGALTDKFSEWNAQRGSGSDPAARFGRYQRSFSNRS